MHGAQPEEVIGADRLAEVGFTILLMGPAWVTARTARPRKWIARRPPRSEINSPRWLVPVLIPSSKGSEFADRAQLRG